MVAAGKTTLEILRTRTEEEEEEPPVAYSGIIIIPDRPENKLQLKLTTRQLSAFFLTFAYHTALYYSTIQTPR